MIEIDSFKYHLHANAGLIYLVKKKTFEVSIYNKKQLPIFICYKIKITQFLF